MSANPSVFGLLKPPALPPDPLIHAGLAQQLRIGQQVAQQSAAESAQKLQEGSLGIQQKQQELKDQQVYQQVFQQAMNPAAQGGAPTPGGSAPQGGAPAPGGSPPQAGGPVGSQGVPGTDPDAMFKALAQAGLSGKGLMAYQQLMLENRVKQATAAKDNADAKLAQTGAMKNVNEDAAGMAHAFLKNPPADRAALYPAFEQQMLQKGYLDPLKAVGNYQAFGGDQGMMNFLNQHQTATEQGTQDAAALKLKSDQAEADRAALLGGAKQTEAENLAKTTAPVGDTGMTAQEVQAHADKQAELRQTAARDAATASNARAQRGIEAGKLAIDQKKFDVTFGAGLDANGKPLSPEDRKAVALLDPTAVAQANYQVAPPPPPRNGMPSPQMAKVLAINPAYDGTKFAERNKIAQDFSASGASGKAMTSSDTALAHLDAISRAGAALKNGDVKAINGIANEIGAQLGASPKNTYDTIVTMVAPEISKAVIGEAGGEGERQAMAKNFASDTAPEVREKAIGAAAGLLGARVHKQAQAYESDMGKPFERKLSPESQAVLDRYSGAGGGAPGTGATLKTSEPKIGTIEEGHVYVGGPDHNAKNPANWKKAQ
jgi:hypothetical protein